MASVAIDLFKSNSIPSVSVVDINPETARQWLERNIGNRPASPAHVAKLEKAIKDGKWKMTGDPIRFSKTGKLIDGQHRLQAILNSGLTVTCVVMRDLDDEIFDVLDSGKGRQKSDVSNPPENLPEGQQGDTRDLAAKAAGYGNGKTYEQAKRVTNEAAPELVQAMDEGRASVSAASALLSLPKEKQAKVAVGDKKSIQQAAKVAKAPPVEQPATEHVLYLINQMDLIARYLSRSGLTASEAVDKFLSEVDPSNPVIADRLAATMPVMGALGRISAEIGLEVAA